MSTKILTGTYSAGYTLQAPVSTLSISASGYVEGAGVATHNGATSAYTVVNDGRIVAASQATGVYLGDGGAVTNGSASGTSALVSGYRGVEIQNAAGTVANFGTIVGTARSAVFLAYGGMVTNGSASDITSAIRGSNGVVIDYSLAERLGTVVNFGAISGAATASGQAGVYLGPGYGNGGFGAVANGSSADQTASIAGYSGVVVEGNASIVNFGSIIGLGGRGGSGVYVRSSGEVVNGALGQTRALIRGFTGVTLGDAFATLTNFGTISGSGGTAVNLQGNGDALVVEAGCVFVGAVSGGSGLLDLASGTGTLSNLAGGNVTVSGSMATTSFTNFGTVEVGAGAQFSLPAGGSLTASQTLIVAGALTEEGTLANAGVITVAGQGSLTVDGTLTDTGAGVVMVAAAGVVGLRGDLGGTGDMVFDVGSTLTGQGLIASSTFTADGTIIATGGAVTFTGSATFAGSVTGGGTLAFAGGSEAINAGANITVANWALSGGAATSLDTSLTYTGGFALGAGSSLTIASGDTLTLSGSSTIIAGAISGPGAVAFAAGVATIGAGGALGAPTISVLAGATVSFSESLTLAGKLTEAAGASLSVGGNSLTLTGVGSSLAGAVSGAGDLVFDGGSQNLVSGASLTVGHWTLESGATATVNTNLTYAGALSEGVGAHLVMALGDNLTLSGSSLAGGSLEGLGRLIFSGGSARLNGPLSVASVSLASDAAVTIAETLTYAGLLNQSSGTALNLLGLYRLTLTGAGTVLAGSIGGAKGELALAGWVADLRQRRQPHRGQMVGFGGGRRDDR